MPPVRVALLPRPECMLHEMGVGHPERPARLRAIEEALRRLPLLRVEAPEATREQLLRVHDAGYFDWLASVAPREGLFDLDPDTAMNPHTLPAALRAAGAAVPATDLAIAGQAAAAFCALRPPGPHPEPA